MASLGVAGRLVRAGCEALVAPAATPTPGDEGRGARLAEVGQRLTRLVLEGDGAGGHVQGQVLALGAGAELGPTRTPLPALEAPAAAVVLKRVHVVHGAQEDTAASATVAAIGSAQGYELLPVEGRGATPSGTAFHRYANAIEHRN